MSRRHFVKSLCLGVALAFPKVGMPKMADIVNSNPRVNPEIMLKMGTEYFFSCDISSDGESWYSYGCKAIAGESVELPRDAQYISMLMGDDTPNTDRQIYSRVILEKGE